MRRGGGHTNSVDFQAERRSEARQSARNLFLRGGGGGREIQVDIPAVHQGGAGVDEYREWGVEVGTEVLVQLIGFLVRDVVEHPQAEVAHGIWFLGDSGVDSTVFDGVQGARVCVPGE